MCTCVLLALVVAVDQASPDLKASIAARAFPLRYPEDDEVKTSWGSLGSELFQTIPRG